MKILHSDKAAPCDLLERDLQSLPVRHRSVTFTIQPFEMVTVKWRLKQE